MPPKKTKTTKKTSTAKKSVKKTVFKKGDQVEVDCPGLKKLHSIATEAGVNVPPCNLGWVDEVLEDGTVVVLFPIGDDDPKEHSQVAPYPPEQVKKKKWQTNADRLKNGEPIAEPPEETKEDEPRVEYGEPGENGRLISPEMMVGIDQKMREKNKDHNRDKLPDMFDTLTLKQKLFCELYTSSEECFGNGTKSYWMAYGCDYSSAEANAYRMMDNDGICAYIDHLLDEKGLNNQYVDKRLLELIRQRGDKRVSLSAIQEYNKIKQRTTFRQVDITTKGEAVHTLEEMSRGFLGQKEEA